MGDPLQTRGGRGGDGALANQHAGKDGGSLMSHSGKVDGTAACAACGFANPAGFKFCGSCGANLAASRPRPSRQVAAERRQITVLFCDLVGSTSLANNLELEELRDVIRGFQAACAAVVRQFGGTISRYMGDGILVLFGYPHAHEDDAERAVRAGLSMVQAVARLRPPAAAAGPLAARVGIATGLVVAGDLIGDGSAEEEAILGETPNLAGRLHASAPPGGVVIASSTHALLGGRFLCENLGSQTIKGFGAPIRVWQVIAPRSISSHFKAADAAQLTPIVGREADLAWLHRPLAIGDAPARMRHHARGRGRNRQVARRRGAARSARRRLRAAALPVLAALRQSRAASDHPAHRARRRHRRRGSRRNRSWRGSRHG